MNKKKVNNYNETQLIGFPTTITIYYFFALYVKYMKNQKQTLSSTPNYWRMLYWELLFNK